jgi:hypothetical protein
MSESICTTTWINMYMSKSMGDLYINSYAAFQNHVVCK